MVAQDQIRVQHEKMKIEIHAEREELEKKRKASYDHLQQLSTVTPAQKKPSFIRNSFMVPVNVH